MHYHAPRHGLAPQTRVFCCNHQGHDLEGSTGVCAFHAIAGDRHASCRAALSASIRSQHRVRAGSAHLLDEDVDGAATREPDRPAQLVADAVMQKSRRCITFEHDLSLENDRGFQAAPAYRAGRPSVAAHQQPRPRTRRGVEPVVRTTVATASRGSVADHSSAVARVTHRSEYPPFPDHSQGVVLVRQLRALDARMRAHAFPRRRARTALPSNRVGLYSG